MTATDPNDAPASFTNFGTWVESAAPGVDIYSTTSKYRSIPGLKYPYDHLNGTSMAAPHVAGVAALIWSRFPQLTRDQVRIHLRKTADDLGQSGFDIYYGYGRVNAKKAVEQDLPEHDLLILDWKRTPYAKMGNITLNATILNYGADNESNVIVQLWLNGSLSTHKSIEFLASGNSTLVQLSCPVPASGVYNVTVCVVPRPDETDTADNTVWAYGGAESRKIKVPQHYQTIQDAVESASADDIIQVSPGTYNEAVHVHGMNNLSLMGENRETTVINGSGVGRGIWVVYAVSAYNFHISDFTLQNSGSPGSSPYFFAGIALYDGSDSCTVSNNIVSKNDEGIHIYRSYNNNITHNTIISNYYEGIELFAYSGGNLISDNLIESNQGAGVGLYDYVVSSGNTVRNNVIKGNLWGIDVYSDNNGISGNKITFNSEYGVSLWCTSAVVRGNHLKGNSQGILFEYGASSNRIYWSNFINNTLQVISNGLFNNWSGRWNVTGNHWSNYNGADMDSDGRGDTPYIIERNNVDYYPLMSPWLPGDVNNDGKVDGKDIARIAKAYGSYPGHPYWNPRADLNEDAIINDLDINIAAANFGKTWKTYWGE